MGMGINTVSVQRALWAGLPKHEGHRVLRWELGADADIVNVWCECRAKMGDGWTAWLSTDQVLRANGEMPRSRTVSSSTEWKLEADGTWRAQSYLPQQVGKLEAEVNRLLEVVHRLEPRARAWDRVYEGCEPTEGAIREVRAALHAFPEERRRWCHESDEKPPTARQAESGPSAVASAKPAAQRRPLVVYSEDD